LIGDGRFLGLGLMAPAVDIVPGVHAFVIADGLVGQPDRREVARALRRAVMARVQSAIGARDRLAPFFSGHAEDGAPIRRSRSSHLSFAFEPTSRLLLVLAPHIVERRAPAPWELEYLRTLDIALDGFRELRAGDAGLFTLSPTVNGDDGEDTFL
jgi:CRISPR-associated protein Csb2